LTEFIALTTVQSIAAITQVFSADTKVSATSSQGIRRYVRLMTALKFSSLKLNNVLLKIIAELLELAIFLFRMTFRISYLAKRRTTTIGAIHTRQKREQHDVNSGIKF
jgi:hypothetical protein